MTAPVRGAIILRVHRPRVAALATAALIACGDAGGRDTGGPGITTASAPTGPDPTAATAAASTGDDDTAGPAPTDTTAPSPTQGDPTTAPDDPTGGPPPLDCTAHPDDPACDCDARRGDDYVLGPCAPACRDEAWRYVLWLTSYNVAGTLGYGEHQGLGVLGTRYLYDRRYAPADGVDAPWRPGGGLWSVGAAVTVAEQFRARTTAPGGEVYEVAEELPGDADDLFSGETSPRVPVLLPHPELDVAALCEPPETVLDRRFYNHGRTLAEEVPNHPWDSFFIRRDLIPLQALAAIEVVRRPDGTLVGPGTAAAVEQCLDTLRDGFCDARCGNCSYVLSTGFGVPLGDPPANQIDGIPQGTHGPYQIGPDGALVDARDNFSRLEDGRVVWYVGGSSFGRAAQVAEYDPWPDPDPVVVDPGSFLSVVGPLGPGETIPDQYEDAFTHCVDPDAWVSSQSPILTTPMISGRWGHNSNSDAQADLVHFLDCADDPVAAADPLWWNDSACLACGEPRLENGAPTQAPCQDLTFTAASYWDAAPGAHDVDDLDLGRYTAVGPERVEAARMSLVPDPVCAFSQQPVFGM
jgi:hypothetical protein